jgi:hypothetical protein
VQSVVSQVNLHEVRGFLGLQEDPWVTLRRISFELQDLVVSEDSFHILNLISPEVVRVAVVGKAPGAGGDEDYSAGSCDLLNV